MNRRRRALAVGLLIGLLVVGLAGIALWTRARTAADRSREDSTAASPGSATKAALRSGRPALGGGAPGATNGGDEVPLWGARIPGLFQGEVKYSLDVDGQWIADPENSYRSGRSDVGTDADWRYSHTARHWYYSLLRWPLVGGQAPDSVRVQSPTTAEFGYAGRIGMAVVFRSPLRGGDWGADEMQPLNAAARANLEALRTDPALGRLLGVVLDHERNPVAGASVRLSQELAPSHGDLVELLRTAVTDGQGAFEIERLATGPAEVAARANGFQVSEPNPARVTRDGGQAIEIVLAKGCMVNGSVTDERGLPKPRAEILATRTDIHIYSANRETATSTDAAGIYEHPWLAPGIYDVQAYAQGKVADIRRNVRLTSAGGVVTLDFVLKDGLSLRGRVIRSDGGERKGVAGATVCADVMPQRSESGYSRSQSAQGTTGADGSFALTGLRPGARCEVSAGLGLLKARWTQPIRLREDAPPPFLELEMPAPVRLAGKVLDPTGAPVSGARVFVAEEGVKGARADRLQSVDHEQLGDLDPVATTGAEGRFALENLSRDAIYQLEASAAGFAPQRSDGVSGDFAEEVVIRLSPGGSIAGHVTLAQGGKPAEGIRVRIEPDDKVPKDLNVIASTDAEGAFRFDHLPPGAYQVGGSGQTVAEDGTVRTLRAARKGEIEVKAGATATVELSAYRAAGVKGRVVAEDGGQPLRGIAVHADLEDSYLYGGMDYSRSFSAGDGTFEVRDLFPGRYSFSADGTGFCRNGGSDTLTELSPDSVVEAIEIRMSRGGIIRGLVTGPDDVPLPNVQVEARSLNSRDGYALSDPQGRFEITAIMLANSPFQVFSVRDPESKTPLVGVTDFVEITPQAPAAEVTLRLLPGGGVSGRVTDEAGQPVDEASVTCRSVGGKDMDRVHGGTEDTNAAGEYTIVGLREGEYQISATKTDHATPEPSKIRVELGRTTTDANLTLPNVSGTPVRGSLISTTGKPLANWSVRFQATRGENSDIEASTDSDGAFAIGTLPGATGRFLFSFSGSVAPGIPLSTYSIQSAPCEMPTGEQTAPLRFAFSLRHAIQGRFVQAGTKKPMAEIRWIAAIERNNEGVLTPSGGECTASEFGVTGQTDAEGRFRVAAVPYGTIWVTSQVSKTRSTIDRLVMIGPSTPEVTDLGDIEVGPDHCTTGRLLDAATREPWRPTARYSSVNLRFHDANGMSLGSQGLYPEEDGRFTLEDAQEDRGFTFEVPGYLTVEVPPGKASADGNIQLGDILLERGKTVVGTVVDAADGTPIAEAPGLAVTFLQPDRSAWQPAAMQTADSPGGFVACNVPDGVEVLRLSAPKYTPRELTALPAADTQGRIDLGRVELEREVDAATGQIAGTARDGGGTPCYRCYVTAWRKSEDGTVESPGRGGYLTSDDGRFRILNLTTGVYVLNAQGDGYAPNLGTEVAVSGDGTTTTVALVMTRNSVLRGTIMDLNAGRLVGWSVSVVQPPDLPPSWGARSWGQSDALGAFKMADVATDPFRLEFSKKETTVAGFSKMEFRSAPVVASDQEQVFVLPLGGEITGRIVDEEGQGVAGVRAEVRQGATGGDADPGPASGCALRSLDLVVQTATDAEGRLRVGPVAPGSAHLLLSGESFAAVEIQDVRVGSDGTCNIGDVKVQMGGVIVGRLVRRSDGRPLLGCAVVGEWQQGRRSGGDGKAGACLTVNAYDGTFRITGVPPDIESLSLVVGKHPPVELEELAVELGKETNLGDVAVSPEVVLRVRILDAVTGKPLVGTDANRAATIKGSLDGGRREWSSDTSASVQRGVYVFGDIPVGLRSVTIATAGFEPVVVDPLPAPNLEGVIDLGDRPVRPKPPAVR